MIDKLWVRERKWEQIAVYWVDSSTVMYVEWKVWAIIDVE